MNIEKLLNQKFAQYNHIDFIEHDPISIPHLFTQQQDIEIAAFFAAILAWGNRKTIIKSAKKLMQLMDNAPYDFVLHLPNKKNLEKILGGFVHRTFNAADAIHLLQIFHHHYKINKQYSLETAFTKYLQPQSETIETALNGFYHFCFTENNLNNYPTRTTKHIAAPFKNSACKRLNMFLRWMVRQDTTGVDFGIWKNIQTCQLVIPLDVHVIKIATHYNLFQSSKPTWQTALQLTTTLKQFDANDPVKYDYALFGMGVNEDMLKKI